MPSMALNSYRPTLADLPVPPAGKSGWPWTEAGPRPDRNNRADMDLPAVAIVTPSFQQGEFLEETIRSVLLQDYPRLNYVVMDGGSTDASVAIIQRYAPWLSDWVSEPDGGQAAAIDNGFQRIAGDILTWVNSDDVLAPGAVWAAVDAFGRDPDAVLVYGGADEMTRAGDRRGPATYVRQVDRQYLVEVANAIPQPSAYFKRSAYEAAGRLDHGLHWAMDYDLWIRLSAIVPIVYLPETLSRLRIYSEAKTSSGDPAMFEEFRTVGERYGGFGLLNQMVGWIVPGLLPQALEALRQGDVARGQAWLMSVIENDPAWRSEPRLAEALVGIAWRRMTEAGLDSRAAADWISNICRSLPGQYISPASLEQQVLGLLYEALAFRSYRQGRTAEGLRYTARAITKDRRRAANRGLWSMTMRSIVQLAA